MAEKKKNAPTSTPEPQLDETVTPECFVIMPISDQPGYDSGHFGKVYEDIFKPACTLAGYKATRADDVKQSNLIHLDILKRVVHSPMAICDLSSRNPNVLFELGLRQAFDKPTILVKDEETPDIFDIAPIRYTTYHRALRYREVLADQKAVAEAIRSTRDSTGQPHNVNSLIRLLELSAPAKITEGGAQDPNEYFQVLIAELAQLRREVRNTRQQNFSSKGQLAILDLAKNEEELAGRALKVRKRTDSILQAINEGAAVSDLQAEIQSAVGFTESALQYYTSDAKPEFVPRLRSVVSDLERLRALSV
jgi:hypothetical protein